VTAASALYYASASSATSSAWTGHDTRVVLCALAGIVLVVLLTAILKIHPFLALIAGSLLVAFSAALPVDKILTPFETGVGSTLGDVGVIVALGAMLGKLLVDSGGADRLVGAIIDRVGPRYAPWAMLLGAMIVGIPMFFETALVLLIPIIYLAWRRTGGSILRVGIPALAGLSILHGLIPPHPGPLIAVDAVHANIGETLALGILVAIPTAAIAGPLFGNFIAKRVNPEPPQRLADQYTTEAAGRTGGNVPSVGTTLAVILLPVAIMLARTVVDVTTAASTQAHRVADFVGDPIIALCIAVVAALMLFRFERVRAGSVLAESLPPIAGILLIIGAGGGFKQVLITTGIADSIGKAAHDSHLSLLLLAWLVAVAIRVATGSATVATVTASGIIAPIAATSHGTSTALLALAVGSGSLFLSQVNDAGFWLVKEFFGMDVKQTLKSWSAMETILSCVSIVVILALGTFVH
jgi:GntP family gluconate:H+ symporter